MKALITGGMGGIGRHVSKTFLDSGIETIIFDYDQKSKFTKWFPQKQIVWGDITDPSTYRDLLSDLDAIIHLAFLTKNSTKKTPQRAREVNVGGTQSLIEELTNLNWKGRLIFASSTSIFGPTAHLDPPITIDHPLNPNDDYSRHKVECEELIKESSLNWVIFRFSIVPYIEVLAAMGGSSSGEVLAYPHDQRMEIVHVKDAAMACKNALTVDCVGKTFIIAGGPKCRITYYDLISHTFAALQLPPPPQEKFAKEPANIDWYDTTPSQEILQYQNLTFDDYILDVQKYIGKKRFLLHIFSPISKRILNKKLEGD